MVKWAHLLVALALSGCALIDALGEEEAEDDYHALECGWQPCGCGFSDCDPRFDCETVGCTTCLVDSHCSALFDTCDNGVCSSCYNAEFSSSVAVQTADGEEFVCEANPEVPNPVCLRNSCFQ